MDNPKIEELLNVVAKNIPAQHQNQKADILEILNTTMKLRFQKTPSEQEWYIENILTNPIYLDGLITDLVLLYRIDNHSLSKERPNLHLMADFQVPIKQTLMLYAHKKIQAHIFIQPNIEIHAPKLEFIRAVTHMVDNACKFSQEGKDIIIYLAGYGVGGGILTVIDDGDGIAPGNHNLAFERNMFLPQGKTRNISLKFGLPIVRGVASHLDGSAVILKSMRGCGVQMTIPPEPV